MTVNKVKTECVHGHALTADNVYETSSGRRLCRTCRRATQQRWYGVDGRSHVDATFIEVDGTTVTVLTRMRTGDFGANNRVTFSVSTTGEGHRGVVYRVDHGEVHHIDGVDAVPHTWYCRPVRLRGLHEIPVLGPFDGQVDAISALLRCHDRR